MVIWQDRLTVASHIQTLAQEILHLIILLRLQYVSGAICGVLAVEQGRLGPGAGNLPYSFRIPMGARDKRYRYRHGQ